MRTPQPHGVIKHTVDALDVRAPAIQAREVSVTWRNLANIFRATELPLRVVIGGVEPQRNFLTVGQLQFRYINERFRSCLRDALCATVSTR